MSVSNSSSASSVLSTTTASGASAQTASGLASLTSNFQSFLSLLTTQLQNQDPTNPMDTNTFTQQLVEMTGVQQQLLTNNLLTTLVSQGQSGLSNATNNTGDSTTAPDLSAGVSSFTWNGKDSSGVQLPNGGTYTMAVTATDASGN